MSSIQELQLNARAFRLVERLREQQGELRVDCQVLADGSLLVDAGVNAHGGLEAGVALARLCLADLASVSVTPGELPTPACPQVVVRTDHPVAACMASQYAGWQVALDKFFAMGSGPMRAAYGKEELFDDIGHRESAERVVGILESATLPDPEVFSFIAEKTDVRPGNVALCVARTKSLAGNIQVVARSVETALHKLHAIGFDLSQVVSGFGAAPLPPPAGDDLQALGRTNDAVLYGGRVTLWVRAEDKLLAEIGPQVPSSASDDHGAPFVEIFERYERDFYKIDANLFSPAEVSFVNLESGRTHAFGRVEPDLLKKSFGLA